MKEKLICPKCNNEMFKGIHEDSKTLYELGKMVDIYKYVCTSCGYVEEYADIEKMKNN